LKHLNLRLQNQVQTEINGIFWIFPLISSKQ